MGLGSIFRGIGRVVVSPLGRTVLSTLVPGAGDLLMAVIGAVGHAETAVPGPKMGLQRLPVAKEEFYSQMTMVNALLRPKGKILTYPDDKLEAAINAQVAAANAIRDLSESMELADVKDH